MYHFMHLESTESISVTDYFNVMIDDIEKMAKENEKLSNLLQLHLQTNHSSLCG